jgi:7,8-didemethyl-8-hydroxy-5-deazariboflavin synthase CofH subunit
MSLHDIKEITGKVVSDNLYLTVKEAACLFEATAEDELSVIQEAADALRKKLNGDVVSYTINQNINFTNICECNCLFCGFRRNPDDSEAYIISLDELYDKLKIATSKGSLEVCYQGGLYSKIKIPGLNAKNILDLYAKLLLWTKEHFPEIITHAYSPEEIDFLCIMTDKSVRYVLEYLKDYGLDTMPGTAAEILVDEVREKICPKKLNTARWSEIIKLAHTLNVPTTATIMYGHFETPEDMAKHLNVIRNIQKETGGFTEFIPLPLVATKTMLSRKVKPLNPEERLKMLAVSRLFFQDLIPNIQASWVKQGMEETRESLNWGVNDIGGTLGDERITFEAGGEFGKFVEAEDLIKLIISSNKKPVLRDTFYHHLLANIRLAC